MTLVLFRLKKNKSHNNSWCDIWRLFSTLLSLDVDVEQVHRKNTVPAISFLQFIVDVTRKSREASVKLVLIIQKRIIYNYRQSCHMCDQQECECGRKYHTSASALEQSR